MKCIKRKSFFINNFDIKKLSKDNNKFKTWMKNLITILKANMEPYYTELSVFLLNNPYETLIKNNEKNEDKYNKVLKTMLLIEKLQRFLAILNRKPSEILIK